MSRSKHETHKLSRAAGFTLFEVVVALAIAALGIAALLAATSQGLQNARTADRYLEAVRRAQSHLAEIGITSPLKPGETSGDDGGGYLWRNRISAPVLHEPASGPAAPKPLGLYTIEASIIWQEGTARREVSLQSKRTGPP